MIILGINGGVRPGYQDTSAVLTVNGEVIAAVEEERLNRIKHAPGQWPYLAILEVLKLGGIRIEEVDIVATHLSHMGMYTNNLYRNIFTTPLIINPRLSDTTTIFAMPPAHILPPVLIKR